MRCCKILVIPATDWYGGPESRLHRIFEDYSRDDVSVEIMYIPLTGLKRRSSKNRTYRYPVITLAGSTSFFYLLNLIPLWISTILYILKNHSSIIVTTNPIISYPMIFLKRLLGIKLVFDYVDDISGLALGYIPKPFRLPAFHIIRKIVYSVLKASDRIIVSSKYLETRVSSFLSNKPFYIPNGVDTDLFDRHTQSSKIGKTIGYIGGLYEWSGVEEFIATYPQVRKAVPSVEYHIYGNGTSAKSIKEKSDELDGVFYHGEIPYEQVPRVASQLLIGVIPFVKSPLTDGATPLKLFEYWAAGVPVISRELKEVQNICKNNCLLFSNSAELIDCIIRLLTDNLLYHSIRKCGLELVKCYDWKKLANSYYTILLNGWRDGNINEMKIRKSLRDE